MANNRTKNVTLPLKASLNMTTNLEQVSNSYDQLNQQNSPVYGGTIAPLHTFTYSNNNTQHKWTKFADPVYFSGNTLYGPFGTVSVDKYFEDTTYQYDLDGACFYNGSLFGGKIKDNYLYIYKDGVHVDTFDANSYVSSPGSYISIHFVPDWGSGLALLAVLQTGSTVGTGAPMLQLSTLNGNGTTFGVRAQDYFEVRGWVGPQDDVTLEGQYANISGSTGYTSGANGNTYPILVSGKLNGDGGYRGVTVLARHLRGENTMKLKYCNFIYNAFTNQKAWQDYFLLPGSSWRPNLCNVAADYSNRNEGTGWRENYYTRSDYFAGAGGIFIDGDTHVYRLGTNTNSQRLASDHDSGVFSWTASMGTAGSVGWTTQGGRNYAYCPNSQSGVGFYADTGSNATVFPCVRPQVFRHSSIVTNQYHYRMLVGGPNNYDKGPQGPGRSADYGTWLMVDSMNPEVIIANPGIQSNTTIPTNKDSWDSIYPTKPSDGDPERAVWNSQGAIHQIAGTPWRILFNYRQGYISGISYGAQGYMGVLVTEWDSVDDSFMICADSEKVVYKDAKNGKIHVIYARNYSSLSDADKLKKVDIVDNRYIVINSNRELNCYDIVSKKWGNWASDWNNRIIAGAVAHKFRFWNTERGCMEIYSYETLAYDGDVRWHANASIASGQNTGYSITKDFTPSKLDAYQNYSGIILGYERAFSSASSVPVDYYSSDGTGSPSYTYSFTATPDGTPQTTARSILEGSTYPVTSSGNAYYNMPITGIEFINGYNGKFGVKIDGTGYNMVYDGVRPIGVYNSTSMVDDISEFFIVQSQYYAVVNNYIAAISYSSSGAVSGVEQIVDVNGMSFIGAFPSVAYFWSPATHSIFAFTGDADLQLFVQSNRINNIYDHLYAPNNEWIYLATDDGLYVMTQLNVFRVPDVQNITSMWATDKGYNVIEYDGKAVYMALPRLTNFETKPVVMETEFFGPGDMKNAVVDCWYIRLYKGEEDNNGEVVLSLKTLTDIVRKTDEKTMKITEDMWDDNNCCYIRYQPKYQACQGSSLHIESPYPIAYVGFSITEEATQLNNTQHMI